ncbi:MAG: leucyl/phenylalanyl-tRNA--protein transferase [Pseudomonadales bacterium]|nr:leucyl/phenylalanyl-tRNA--protein transferase [Pseudomonadales bacterium]
MIPWLDEEQVFFPDISTALPEPDGLLAAGGNLLPSTLINAYSQGIFPWYSDPDPVLWWSPNPRCLLKPEEVHISKSMKKLLKKNTYSITWDTAFEDVIRACGQPRDYSDDTWITQEMICAYCQLHDLGVAHSIEVWSGKSLVGGLYGIAIGSVFFGESMFSTQANTSKIAFIQLCLQLQQSGFHFIDCQVESEHLLSLGAYTVDREVFKAQLKQAINNPIETPPWQTAMTPQI